ncbi:hypothetical protein ACFPOE_23925 [Caenimonas terrae]|uniref:Uncharacterized protein n=1 Tax=Caenimonas terrae TaxID=696074 RepID=A0ABW0NN79_9BURK
MDADLPPSLLVRLVATTWLVFRRLVCFAGAIFFTAQLLSLVHRFVWMDEVFGPAKKELMGWERVETAAALAACIALFVFIGVVGVSISKSDPLLTYRDQKRRYGWRW